MLQHPRRQVHFEHRQFVPVLRVVHLPEEEGHYHLEAGVGVALRAVGVGVRYPVEEAHIPRTVKG